MILLLSLYTICKVQIDPELTLPSHGLSMMQAYTLEAPMDKKAATPSAICTPLSDSDWPQEIADLREGFAGQLNVYRTMAHHPSLLRAWAPLRQHLVKDSALGPERSEVVILRTGHRLGSQYEWAHHVSRARVLGFTDARILAIAGEPVGEDGLIVQAVDALFDLHHIPEKLEAELAQTIGHKAVFDLIATVGFYSILGSILLSYNTPLDRTVADEFATAPITADKGHP
jgi:4-carboxymuconolactone decarboxylase